MPELQEEWMSIVHEDFDVDEQGGGIAPGAIVATAVAAGLAAFLIRRATHREKQVETPVEVAAAAWDRVSDPNLRGRTVAATRDFFTDRVLPEMKPVLLDLVRDIKGYVDDAFRRIEQAIRDI
jgi:hypothetical protein